MMIECSRIYDVFKKAKLFNFRSGANFNNYLQQFANFPDDGIYLMFEAGEINQFGSRVVRIGINTTGSLAARLNKHINGNNGNSIFRRHLFRILGSDEQVTDHIQKKISFCIIRGPRGLENRRMIEKELIGTFSNYLSDCNDCRPSFVWLGRESQNLRIKNSGLWNVHHVNHGHGLTSGHFDYIERHVY